MLELKYHLVERAPRVKRHIPNTFHVNTTLSDQQDNYSEFSELSLMAPAIFALTCFTERCICSKVFHIGTLRTSGFKLAAILRWRSSDTCNTANTRSQQRYCYIKNTINYADDHNEHHEHQLEDVKRVEHQLEDAKRVEGRQDDKDGGQEQERDSRHLGFKCN